MCSEGDDRTLVANTASVAYMTDGTSMAAYHTNSQIFDTVLSANAVCSTETFHRSGNELSCVFHMRKGKEESSYYTLGSLSVCIAENVEFYRQ
jgi:hypothetical protein